MIDLPTFESCDEETFREEVSRVLTFLQTRLGFGLWMFTRVEGDDWIVINSADQCYGVGDGDIFQWADSFCSRMVVGKGPHIAPDSDQVETYRSAAIGKQVSIRSYIGMPIKRPNGELFGTLCAIDPNPKPASIVQEQPLLDMCTSVINRLVAAEMKAHDEAREVEAEETGGHRDEITGLRNRHAWQICLDQEEARAQALQSPTILALVRLQSASNNHIVAAAELLTSCIGERGQVFRIRDDEFGILLPDTQVSSTRRVMLELRATMFNSEVKAKMGIAPRDPKRGMHEALSRAYEELELQQAA